MDGVRHGHGSMAWQDGTVYQGEWKCGQVTGCGFTSCCLGSDIFGSSLMDLGSSTIPAELDTWANS